MPRDEAQTDESVARQIQHRIWLDEERARRAAEEADERLAQKLEQRERARQMKKRTQREKQQVERLSQQIGADYGLESSGLAGSSRSSSPPSPPVYQRILTEDEQELDLSEFCMPPPPGLTPEELKYFLEEQDAEIARLLQTQESKRNKNPEKEKLAVIEAQDYELALMLQKMEKDRVKRIRDKIRYKQGHHHQRGPGTEESAGPSFAIGHLEHGNYQRTSTPISLQNSFEEAQLRASEEHEYDIPENHLQREARESGDTDSLTYEEPYQLLAQLSETRPQQPFHNIAMDLDPTYQRRVQSTSLLPGYSASNLPESCVDDDDTASSRHFRSNDSLEKHHRSSQRSPEAVSPQPVMLTSTSSSRSSRTSSASHHSGNSQRSNHSANHQSFQLGPMEHDEDYAPPLPPRDVSLLSRHKVPQTGEPLLRRELPSPPQANILPPHHPQHPNRLNVDSMSSTSGNSPNRASIYSTSSSSNVFIQGHRRVYSMEKQKKEKHKSPDGCKTQ